jgi:hypothetical protein
MELKREIASFKNESGVEVKYNLYYVEVLGFKIYLIPREKSDKKILKAGFERKVM